MNTRIVIIFATLAVIATLCHAQDITVLLEDRRYVNKQINCLLDRSPCDMIGRHIRTLLPEVLNNNCGACTPQQARNARILVDFMQQYYPREWQVMVQRYSGTPYNYRG